MVTHSRKSKNLKARRMKVGPMLISDVQDQIMLGEDKLSIN